MRNICVNKIYKLKQQKENNPIYVYCLVASPSHQRGKKMNQKCIGIVMTAPKEAVSIYALISNKKLTNDKIFHELNDKYELVSFWSVDAENEFKDIFVELRETQEINEGNLSNTFL